MRLVRAHALAVVVFVVVALLSYYSGVAAALLVAAASYTTTTITITATATGIPRAVSATAIYGLPVNATGVTFFIRYDRNAAYFGYARFFPDYNMYISINTVAGTKNAFRCDAGSVVSGYQVAYVVCDTHVVEVYTIRDIYILPDVPSFMIYDYYADRILAFINAYPAMAVVDVFEPNGRTVYRGTWLGWMVYGAAANSDSYYLIMYNPASGWWLVRYNKEFTRVLANISIPTPMNANVAVAKYSAFAANDLGVLLILSNGTAVIYTKDLKSLFIIPGSYVRVAASKYHFYLMGSDSRVYVASTSGVVYGYGISGEVRYTMLPKELFVVDKGVVYDAANGVIYILDPPYDLVFLTTTATMYVPHYVTRTYVSTVTETVYGFAPSYAQVAVFIALIMLVIGIYYYLRKR